MANKVVIDIEARLIDSVSKNLDKVSGAVDKQKKRLEELNKKQVKPKVGVEDSKFTRAMDKADQRLKRLGQTKAEARLGVKDQASKILGTVVAKAKEYGGKTFRATLKVIDYATSPIRKLRDMIFNLKTLAAGIVLGATTQKFIMQPVQLADTIESSRIAFQTKLGSAAKAEEFLQSIYKFDEKSPFDTMQIVQITQQMMNMGFAAETVLDDLAIIGDWAASMGKGEEGISRVTLALGQMRQKGKLSSEEMLQLTEAGVSGWDYLARSLGKTIPEVRKLAEDGEIDVNQAIAGILEGMKEFEGAAAANADRTVSGIKDQMDSLIQTYIKLPWGEGLASGLKIGLGEVRDLLDENKDKFKEWGQVLREVGESISGWLAEKAQNIITSIDAITNSDAFKAADGSGKMSMLWQGLIADPISAWWEGEGRAAVQDKAVEIGMFLGEGIAKGLVSFIGNHPIASLLLGGGMGLKVLGKGSMLGGIGTILGNIGTAGGTGILGFGANTAIGLGAGNLAGTASLSAGTLSAIGLGSIAGGVTGGVTMLSGLYDLYQGFKNDDGAKKRSGGWKVGGVGAGAAAGAAIGSIIPGLGTAAGALIGAGVGGVAGWIKGKKSADEYNESLNETSESTEKLIKRQEAALKSLETHFNGMTLEAEEVTATVDRLIGSENLSKFNAMAETLETVSNAYANIEYSASALEKSMWLSTVNQKAKMTEEEIASLQSATDGFLESVKTYATESQFASSQAITHLMGDSDAAKAVMEKSTAYFDEQKKKLEQYGQDYTKALNDALSDGIITVDEQKSLDSIRQSITAVTNQLNKEAQEKESNVLKFRLSGNIDAESFASIISQSQSKNSDLQKQIEEEFGQAAIGLAEGSAEWNSLMESTLAQIGDVHLTTATFGFDKIEKEFSNELGYLTENLGKIVTEHSMTDILYKMGTISEADRDAIGQLVESMKPTTEQIQSVVDRYEKLGKEPPQALLEYLQSAEWMEAISKGPQAVQDYLNSHDEFLYRVDIDGVPTYNKIPNPTAADFGLTGSISHTMSIAVQAKTRMVNSLLNPEQNFRGGLVEGFSNGGMVHGGGKIIKVAEEGDAEMIIPLSLRRRDRAMGLWRQTGKMLNVPGFARGGVVGGNEGGISRDTKHVSNAANTPSKIEINVGGVELQVKVEGGQDAVQAIQAQKEQLAEEIAGIINRAMSAQFQNMPAKKGA